MTDETYEYECAECQGKVRINVEGTAFRGLGMKFWRHILNGKCKDCLEKEEELKKREKEQATR